MSLPMSTLNYKVESCKLGIDIRKKGICHSGIYSHYPFTLILLFFTYFNPAYFVLHTIVQT